MSRTTRALLFLVRAYQSFFSALMPSACKFYPTCSHYAVEALRVHGARCGSWLALRRVLRCHPFTRGGVDLVPEAPSPEPNASPFCHSGPSEQSPLECGPESVGSFAARKMTTASAGYEDSNRGTHR